MKFAVRHLAKPIEAAARHFPAVVVTGPRRSGKTTLLRRLFPKAQYVLLEDPDVRERVRSDPRGFLEGLTPPVLFDEIQNAPELFAYIRTRIDSAPRRMGQWFFTGSQEAPLMQGVSESMAGRAAIFHLLPLSVTETPKVTLLHGGFPEVLAHPSARQIWFSSYLQTYLERDVREVMNVRDLLTFRRFLSVLASRHGQMLNKTELAAPMGVSVPTIGEWIRVLEMTNQVVLVQPYFRNFGKRLLKTPKLYWLDSGMAAYLVGIRSQAELDRSPFLGALFEGFIAAEILKQQINRGDRQELYYFRDQQGLEVDFVVPRPSGAMWFVECKASKTVTSAAAAPLLALQASAGSPAERSFVVHRGVQGTAGTAVAQGVKAMTPPQFLAELE